jgi:glutaredoxin 2
LKELDAMVFSEDFCTEGGLSYDDIDLWARLRSLSVVKGVEWPEKLGKYMRNFEKKADVPLMDSMAL